jgi:hypothetical protein
MRTLLIFLLMTSVAIAAPLIEGVSGTVEDSEEIVISGSSFGSGPTVLLFDDFEGGADGNQLATDLATVGSWNNVQSSAWTSYSTANKISGSLAARFDSYNYPANLHPVIRADAPAAFDTFYASWWQIIPSGDITPGCGYGGCNWKTVWVCKDDQCDDADVTIATNAATTSWLLFGNDYPYLYSPYLKDPAGSANDVVTANGVWQRFQFYIKGATDSSGEERIWQTNSSGNTRLVMDRDRQTLNSGDTNKRLQFFVNGYVRDTPGSHPTFDDVYIAYGGNAQARVEIGNANTYTGCSNLAVCTPTSWGATSIVCTVRQGSFANDDTAYLYVIDEDGLVSDAEEITIGSAAHRSAIIIIN